MNRHQVQLAGFAEIIDSGKTCDVDDRKPFLKRLQCSIVVAHDPEIETQRFLVETYICKVSLEFGEGAIIAVPHLVKNGGCDDPHPPGPKVLRPILSDHAADNIDWNHVRRRVYDYVAPEESVVVADAVIDPAEVLVAVDFRSLVPVRLNGLPAANAWASKFG